VSYCLFTKYVHYLWHYCHKPITVICISSGILKSLETKSAMTRKNNRQLIKMKETEKKRSLIYWTDGKTRTKNKFNSILTMSLDISHGAPIITSSTYRHANTLKLLSWRFIIGRCAPLLALQNQSRKKTPSIIKLIKA